MTQWGLDTLFNPAKRHMDEEKRRLQTTREQLGDSSGGRRVDLESGKVTIQRHESDPDADDSDAADSDAVDDSELATGADASDGAASSDGAKSRDGAKSKRKASAAKSKVATRAPAELDPNTPAGRARLRRQAAKH
jgi:Family of unknown function (DUF6191)